MDGGISRKIKKTFPSLSKKQELFSNPCKLDRKLQECISDINYFLRYSTTMCRIFAPLS